MKIKLDGTISIPFSYYDDFNILPYVYDKRGGDSVTPVLLEAPHYIRLPRNITKFLMSTRTKKEDWEFIDERVEAPLDRLLPLADTFKLRQYQVLPVRQVIRALKNGKELNSCVLQAGTGFGKTYILPDIVKTINQTTLIIADRKLLIKQMYDEFTANTDATVKVLTSKDTELAEVNIATFQMFIKNPKLLKKFSKDIGFLIVDECHTSPATSFAEVVANVSAKYRLGLSATPTRSDGLTEIITDIFGYVKVIGDNPDKLNVNLVAVRSGVSMYYESQSKYAEGFIEAATSPKMLALVEKTVTSLHKKGRSIMVYATYGKIHDTYKILLEAKGLSVGIISSKTSAKARDKIIEDFNNGLVDILLAGVILSKGISIHRLDTIVSVATHNKESLVQTIGRLRREHDEKQTPLFIDLGFAGDLRNNTMTRFDRLYEMVDDGDKFFNYNIFEFEKMLRR